jgi:phage antirepressor YoqD-like protein
MMLVGMRESKAVRKSVLSKLKELSDRDKPSIPQTYAEALQLAADQAKQLELAAPKVAFVDNLVDRTNLMNATQVAQKHGKSARWLNSKLDEMDVFNKSVKRVRVFKQWFIDSGLGQMKKTEMGYDQPLFTNRGEVWISERLSCDGEI